MIYIAFFIMGYIAKVIVDKILIYIIMDKIYKQIDKINKMNK